MRKAFRLAPLDTWFFRDGTPFPSDAATQLDVGGPFPPAPTAVAGAVRAAIALLNGWSGSGDWGPRFYEVLGNGPENLGQLDLTGPIILQEQNGCPRPLWPAPRHLAICDAQPKRAGASQKPERDPGQPVGFYMPGRRLTCDFGERRFPELILQEHSPPTEDRPKPISDEWWLPTPVLAKVLEGHLPGPEAFVHRDQLWREEPRIGIQRCNQTRRVEQGALYATRHARLREGVRLGVIVDGIPESWKLPCQEDPGNPKGSFVSPFGGESRAAAWEPWDGFDQDLQIRMPIEKVCHTGRFLLIALTPLCLPHEVFIGNVPWEELAGAEVICAFAERPVRIGGWDSIRFMPVPLRNYLAPGTVLYCQVPKDRLGELRNVLEQKGATQNRPFKVGDRKNAGFGLVALGVWKEVLEEESKL